ncbi:MAG: glutamate-5-semialdehyde dehydrogenase [Spirochaetia bacterium]|nr:glutamate-5-semialdehyde dehydrogenase [Spirochaetia bacterium]
MELSSEDLHYIQQLGKNARKASIELRSIGTDKKNNALLKLAEMLDNERAAIKLANSQDVENAQQESLSPALIDRLILSDKSIDSMIQSLNEIVSLKDPVGEIISGWTQPNGLNIKKVRVPIGVIAIIYESRPNVTIDVAALGLKSSNAVILRGGKEAIHSNKILTQLFQKSVRLENISTSSVQLVEHTQRNLLYGLLRLKNDIDLIVPRGGEGLINFVSQNSLIPVIKHDKGVCHMYLHNSSDKEKAIPVVINSKVQRPGVCNALETLLLDKDLPYAEEVLLALVEHGVNLHGDTLTREFYENLNNKIIIHNLTDEGYHKEYLSLDISIKVVDSLEGAISHINEYSSLHSEAIISESYSAIEIFLNKLDSAALLVNTSTRFHDGGQFGLGAEVGISTGKLHCRGPMGLSDLTTAKYIVSGNGQIRV